MTAEIENLVLEQLRYIRADMSELKAEIRDLKYRMTSLEATMAGVKYETAACFDTDARQQSALDKLSIRVERIEKRLDLRD